MRGADRAVAAYESHPGFGKQFPTGLNAAWASVRTRRACRGSRLVASARALLCRRLLDGYDAIVDACCERGER
jgi:hypothetical protein